MKKLIENYCKSNDIPENELFVCNNSYAKCNNQFRANYPKLRIDENLKYIIQYFKVIDKVIIWQKTDHKPKTSVFTISRKKVEDVLDKKLKYALKGIEYDWWKESKVIICDKYEVINELNKIYNK